MAGTTPIELGDASRFEFATEVEAPCRAGWLAHVEGKSGEWIVTWLKFEGITTNNNASERMRVCDCGATGTRKC